MEHFGPARRVLGYAHYGSVRRPRWRHVDRDRIRRRALPTRTAGSHAAFGRADGVATGMLASFAQDRDGRVWIGSNANGLSVYEGGRFRTPSRGRKPAERNIAACCRQPRRPLDRQRRRRPLPPTPWARTSRSAWLRASRSSDRRRRRRSGREPCGCRRRAAFRGWSARWIEAVAEGRRGVARSDHPRPLRRPPESGRIRRRIGSIRVCATATDGSGSRPSTALP